MVVPEHIVESYSNMSKKQLVQQDILDEYIGFSNDDKRETFLIENQEKINIKTLEYLHNDEPSSDLADLIQNFIDDKNEKNIDIVAEAKQLQEEQEKQTYQF